MHKKIKSLINFHLIFINQKIWKVFKKLDLWFNIRVLLDGTCKKKV